MFLVQLWALHNFSAWSIPARGFPFMLEAPNPKIREMADLRCYFLAKDIARWVYTKSILLPWLLIVAIDSGLFR